MRVSLDSACPLLEKGGNGMDLGETSLSNPTARYNCKNRQFYLLPSTFLASDFSCADCLKSEPSIASLGPLTVHALVTFYTNRPGCLDLLQDLIQVVALRGLQRRVRDVRLKLLQPQYLAERQHVLQSGQECQTGGIVCLQILRG